MDNTSFAQTIGTDRLQKAIERNKRKQELRGIRSNTSNLSPNTFDRSKKPETIEVSTSSRPWAPPSSPKVATPSSSMGEEFSQRMGPRVAQRRAAPVVTSEVVPAAQSSANFGSARKQVATGDQLEFSTELRTAPTKAAAVRPSYTSAKRKVKTKRSTDRFSGIMLKSAWVFCGFLLLRLIFSNGGILDYNERNSMLEGRVAELEAIKLDNQKTLGEIDLIQKDSTTQKKLVRDHLGFIARDEYLIIFQKDNSKSDQGITTLGSNLSASL